jgi:hypothetical protein
MQQFISGSIFKWALVPLVIAIVLQGCVLTPPETPPDPGQEVRFRCEQLLTLEEVQTNHFLLTGQIILTGSQEGISAVVDALSAEGISLRAVEACELNYLDEPIEARDEELGYPPTGNADQSQAPDLQLPFHNPDSGAPINRDRGPLAMNLYQFDSTLIDLPALLRQLAPLSEEYGVYVDPNYMTGHLAKNPCSNPFGLEGSPFGLEGSPFGLEGSPDGGIGAPAQTQAFWSQWAFEAIELGALRDGNLDASADGVLVGVFDTSPFDNPGNYELSAIEPILNIQVEYPFPLPPLELSADIVGPTPDVRDHGLFVAGLVHGVAWDSQIQLVRVLTADGCGDLFGLNKAIHHFISSNRDQRGLLLNTVMNFSLGVTRPREMGLIDLNGIENEIESLETALFEAFRRGAVIVAASGNDSVDGILRLPSELPASYPFVIGVAASNIQGAPACFSNAGDVIAPGADGQIGEMVCTPLAQTCPTVADADGNCEWGLVSLASTSDTGYAYWVGTSFASPLVSGLSAIAYGTTGSQIAVFPIIWSGLQPIGDPTFGAGIINIRDSFSP